MDIPEPQIPQQPELLPSSVAELPEENEPETRPYFLSFSKYNDRLCQLDGSFDKQQRKNALNIIKFIGMQVFSKSDMHRLGLTIKHVVNAGDYSDLYKGLDADQYPDIQVEEVYLSNKQDDKGRLFFFTVDSEKVFYFLAFKNTHIDTSKSSKW